MRTNGVLPVDKPCGCTSREVVSAVRRVYRADKAGHCGTLDPMATGVLVVCLERGTLISRYLASGDKTYEVEALLGVETDTFDITGTVIERKTVPAIREGDLVEAVERFRGSIEQMPPPFSAVKFRGKPLYRYARNGVKVEVKPREVRIDAIELVSFERRGNEALAGIRISCGPGTYVRSLVHDLGGILGCGACVSGLRRTMAGQFSDGEAVRFEELLEMDDETLEERLVSLEKATEWLPTATVSTEGARGVRLGQPLAFGWLAGPPKAGTLSDTFRVLDVEGSLLALYGPPREDDGPDTAGRARRVIKPLVGCSTTSRSSPVEENEDEQDGTSLSPSSAGETLERPDEESLPER